VSWDEFRWFGPVQTARFDHHLAPAHVQDRGILYLGLHGPTTLAEAFQDRRVIDPWEHEPWLVGFETEAPLKLLDLTGPWPTRAGASMALSTGRRDRARRWSQAIFDAYPDALGLWYPSSMDANRPCVALYERGLLGVPSNPRFHAALGDPTLAAVVHRAAARFNFGVVGTQWRP
jgi:RES domain-containing protein